MNRMSRGLIGAGTPTKIATSHRNPGKLDSGQLKLDVEFAE